MSKKISIESIMGLDIKIEPTADSLAYELSMLFSNQVINRCKELNISLSELATKLNIKPSTLSEKLNGQNLTLKSMANMALALNCLIEEPKLVPKESKTFNVALITNLHKNKSNWDQNVPTNQEVMKARKINSAKQLYSEREVA